MRKTHSKPILEVDLLMPLNIPKVKELMTEDNCFGYEWSPRANECSVCASHEICGIITGTVVKEKQKKSGPYLDEVNLTVDWDKITSLIKRCEEAGEPMRAQKLFDHLKKKTKSLDKKLMIMMLDKYIQGNKKLSIANKLIRYQL